MTNRNPVAVVALLLLSLCGVACGPDGVGAETYPVSLAAPARGSLALTLESRGEVYEAGGLESIPIVYAVSYTVRGGGAESRPVSLEPVRLSGYVWSVERSSWLPDKPVALPPVEARVGAVVTVVVRAWVESWPTEYTTQVIEHHVTESAQRCTVSGSASRGLDGAPSLQMRCEQSVDDAGGLRPPGAVRLSLANSFPRAGKGWRTDSNCHGADEYAGIDADVTYAVRTPGAREFSEPVVLGTYRLVGFKPGGDPCNPAPMDAIVLPPVTGPAWTMVEFKVRARFSDFDAESVRRMTGEERLEHTSTFYAVIGEGERACRGGLGTHGTWQAMGYPYNETTAPYVREYVCARPEVTP